MPRRMSSAEALAVQTEFERLAPAPASSEEAEAALEVVSVGLQVNGEGILLRLVGRDGSTEDVFLNPAAAMLINGTLRHVLESEGWVDDEGFVTSG